MDVRWRVALVTSTLFDLIGKIAPCLQLAKSHLSLYSDLLGFFF
jgi:hypothetical protein